MLEAAGLADQGGEVEVPGADLGYYLGEGLGEER